MSLALLLGSALKGYGNAKRAKHEREQSEKELKARTTLAEMQLRRMQEEEQAQRAEKLKATTDARLRGINRDVIFGEAELNVSTGQQKSLMDALADARLQNDMRRHGFDPEKDFGVQKPSGDFRQFQEAQANPDFAAFLEAQNRSKGTQVNVGTGDAKFGKVPEGSMLTDGPGGPRITPVPGSPLEQEQAGRVAQLETSYANSSSALDRLAAAAKSIKANPNLWMGVGFAGASAAIPGTPGADVAADIESLSSQVAFGVLQAMREASKTGGALGSVSERELALLESNLAAIARSQSPEQFRKNLQALIDYADEAKARLGKAYEIQRKPGLGATPPPLGGTPSAGGVVDFSEL